MLTNVVIGILATVIATLIHFAFERRRAAADRRERDRLRARLADARRIITDLVQLHAEQSGRVAPEDCRFMALGCDGQHDPACPVTAAVEWLARGDG